MLVAKRQLIRSNGQCHQERVDKDNPVTLRTCSKDLQRPAQPLPARACLASKSSRGASLGVGSMSMLSLTAG